jgi:hypothetical protein
MLENLRSSCELTLVRSLMKGTHIRLHSVLIDYSHEQSDLFQCTLRFQRRD